MAGKAQVNRDRMVYVGAQALRRSGVAGVALRQVAAEAGAPRGSLQHYFPQGKDQLLRESLLWAGDHAASRVASLVARRRRPSPGRLFADLMDEWVEDLETRDFSRGCPVAAAVVDCADTDGSVLEAAAAALATWRRPIVEALVAMGCGARRSQSLATLMLSSLEGALILARASRSTEPLRAVERELRPLLDAAQRPV